MSDNKTKLPTEEEKRRIAKELAKNLDIRELGKPHDPEKFRTFCEALSYENIEELHKDIEDEMNKIWDDILRLFDELEEVEALSDINEAEPRHQAIMQEFYEMLEIFWANPRTQDLALNIVLLLCKSREII